MVSLELCFLLVDHLKVVVMAAILINLVQITNLEKRNKKWYQTIPDQDYREKYGVGYSVLTCPFPSPTLVEIFKMAKILQQYSITIVGETKLIEKQLQKLK